MHPYHADGQDIQVNVPAPAPGEFGWTIDGESRNVTVSVHGVAPALRLAATATLTPLLTDPSGSTTSLEPVRATTHGSAAPWPLLLLLVVLVVVAGALLLMRRGRARRKSREDARVREAVEKAIGDRSSREG